MQELEHDLMVAHGYEHQHFDATWEDVGDAENGPELDGCPAYEQYSSLTEYLFAWRPGSAVHREPRDLALEAWIDQMADGQP